MYEHATVICILTNTPHPKAANTPFLCGHIVAAQSIPQGKRKNNPSLGGHSRLSIRAYYLSTICIILSLGVEQTMLGVLKSILICLVLLIYISIML